MCLAEHPEMVSSGLWPVDHNHQESSGDATKTTTIAAITAADNPNIM